MGKTSLSEKERIYSIHVFNIHRKILMIVCDIIQKKPEALIKRGTGRSLAHFSIWRINARWLGDNSKVYRPRISSFQATPIFTTKLLGYSTLARFMGLT